MAEDKKEQIELDLDDAQETEVEIGSEEKEEDTPLAAESEDSDDNFEKAKSKTQMRIDRLTKKMREVERQREEAIQYAKNVQAEAQQLKSRMDALDTNYVQEYSNRVETQTASAEQELARAIEIGDTNGVVEAQRKITRLAD